MPATKGILNQNFPITVWILLRKKEQIQNFPNNKIITPHERHLCKLTTKSKTKYTSFNFSKLDIIIFGRESAGVPDYVHNQVHERQLSPCKKDCDHLI